MIVRIWKYGATPSKRETVHSADLDESRINATLVVGDDEFDILERDGDLVIRHRDGNVVWTRNPAGNEVVFRTGEP